MFFISYPPKRLIVQALKHAPNIEKNTAKCKAANKLWPDLNIWIEKNTVAIPNEKPNKYLNIFIPPVV
jgi:hypothetical protein